MIKKLSVLAAAIILNIPWLAVGPVQALAPATVGMVISEVKLGGAVAGQPTEFVEIFNNSDQAVDFDADDWWLEYAKVSAQISDCSNTSWSGNDATGSNVKNTRVTGTIAARGFKVIEVSLNDNAAGAVRLQHNGQIDDAVGWGSASSQPPCKVGSAASAPSNSQSLQRYFAEAGFAGINTDNSQAFVMLSPPTPGTIGPLWSTPTEPDPDPVPNCQSIVINEILPNPAGDDSGHEFIELFNPTSEAVDLTGCILKVGSAQQTLSGLLEPTSYRAFYGLTLPNSSGGAVVLQYGQQTQEASYPGNLKDDEAYGLIDGEWKQGLTPSPGVANSAPSIGGGTDTEESAEPCAPGKYRNPETGRCKNIETGSQLTPCKSGQERSPETNRCRNIAAASSAPTPCKPGQERNLETNRCRNIAAAKTPAPCKEGQERNPETNRCRNVAGAKSTNKMIDPDKKPRPISYYVLGVVALVGLGYAGYEYRHSLRNFFLKRKAES